MAENETRAAEVSIEQPRQSEQSERPEQRRSDTITRESSRQEPVQGPTAPESVGDPPLRLPDSTNSNQPLPEEKKRNSKASEVLAELRSRSREEQTSIGIH